MLQHPSSDSMSKDKKLIVIPFSLGFLAWYWCILQALTALFYLKYKFYSIPSDPERRKRWLFLINREDWIPSKYSRVCSDHFFEKHMDRTGQSVRLRENAAPLRFKMLPQDLKKVICE